MFQRFLHFLYFFDLLSIILVFCFCFSFSVPRETLLDVDRRSGALLQDIPATSSDLYQGPGLRTVAEDNRLTFRVLLQSIKACMRDSFSSFFLYYAGY